MRVELIVNGETRTVEVEQGVFVWCTAGHPDQAPSQLSSRISSLLQVPN